MDSILIYCRQDLQDKQDIFFSAFLKKALKPNPPKGGNDITVPHADSKLFWHHNGKLFPGH